MMRPGKNRLAFLPLILSLALLTGFAPPKEGDDLRLRFGQAVGRATNDHSAAAGNVTATVDTGFEGRIERVTRLSSGAYGVYVEVLSGRDLATGANLAGQKLWIRYNPSLPSRLQYIELRDAGSRPVEDVVSARTAVTTSPGVTATSDYQWGDLPTEAASLCYDNRCATPAEPIESQVTQLQDIVQNPAAASPLRPEHIYPTQAIQPGRNWSPSCSRFVDPAGNYGEFGLHLRARLNPRDYPLFYDGRYVRDVCPRFDQLNVDQKEAFWVWVMAAMSMAESSCDEDRANRNCPNGTCRGLLQLHEGSTHKYGGCPRFDARDPYLTLSCSLNMLNGSLRHGSLINKRTYWEVIRPGRASNKVRGLLNQFQACR